MRCVRAIKSRCSAGFYKNEYLLSSTRYRVVDRELRRIESCDGKRSRHYRSSETGTAAKIKEQLKHAAVHLSS